MGILVQPIVGSLSDKTWCRFGRRIPYLFIGATLAVLVMCLLPNAGSLGLTVGGAMLFGLIALMFLDTSINMAMQPFKMLVGDMVNERQKAKAYSIQSFLCNAGSVMGYIFPFLFTFLGIKNVAEKGVVPDSVIWSFYIGAGWAAMLAMPFTFVTNALQGYGHMGAYLGLFNGTICIPQIVAALCGGHLLHLVGSHQSNMMVVAGILLICGAVFVSLIDKKGA